MARHVYAIVRDIAKKREWSKSLAKPGESDSSVFVVEDNMPMVQVVQEIANRAGRVVPSNEGESPGGMKVLRICAHALPGLVKLGRDHLFDTTVHYFEKLKECFIARGHIELHSCQAGAQRNTIVAGSAGWLTKLATATGVPVMAAEEIQQADENWSWEGPVYTYYPLVVGGYQSDAPGYERMPREDRAGNW